MLTGVLLQDFCVKIYTMPQLAFKMKLFKGFEAEYKRRHDEIWPELVDLLHSQGISDYSIFLDDASGDLFGVLQVESEAAMDRLPAEELMQRWWLHMKDIMESNPDNSPITVPLTRVFYMK